MPDPRWPCSAPACSTAHCLAGTSKPRSEKQVPGSADVFGWCTWDAFYSRVRAGGAQGVAGSKRPQMSGSAVPGPRALGCAAAAVLSFTMNTNFKAGLPGQCQNALLLCTLANRLTAPRLRPGRCQLLALKRGWRAWRLVAPRRDSSLSTTVGEVPGYSPGSESSDGTGILLVCAFRSLRQAGIACISLQAPLVSCCARPMQAAHRRGLAVPRGRWVWVLRGMYLQPWRQHLQAQLHAAETSLLVRWHAQCHGITSTLECPSLYEPQRQVAACTGRALWAWAALCMRWRRRLRPC